MVNDPMRYKSAEGRLMIKPNLILKLRRDGQDEVRVETHSSRRFLHYIRTIKWSNDIKNVYLKVIYRLGVWNDSDGIYSKEELLKLYYYFTEKELLEDTEKAVWD